MLIEVLVVLLLFLKAKEIESVMVFYMIMIKIGVITDGIYKNLSLLNCFLLILFKNIQR
jgi:hypothetical protein